MFGVLFCELSCWACLGLLLSQLKDTPPFSASPLKLVHTSKLYCHIQMILLHFQLKGNVRGADTYLRGCALHVCSCDFHRVIHVQRRMCGIPPTHSFWATNTGSKDNNAIYFSNSTIMQNNVSGFLKNSPLSLAVGWLLWVCACMPVDLF